MWRIEWGVKRLWIGDLGLYRADLAGLTDIRPQTIGRIMMDDLDLISITDLAAICEAMQRNIDEVLILIKDTEELEGEARDEAIIKSVMAAREGRRKERAEQRRLKEEKRRAEEELRINQAVERILASHGLISSDEPPEDGGAGN